LLESANGHIVSHRMVRLGDDRMKTTLLLLAVGALVAIPLSVHALEPSARATTTPPAPARLSAPAAPAADASSAVRIVLRHTGDDMVVTLSILDASGKAIAQRTTDVADGSETILLAKVAPGKYTVRYDWSADGPLPLFHGAMEGKATLDTSDCPGGGASQPIETYHHTTARVLPSYGMTMGKSDCFDASSAREG
jgi:hypothetical protein